MSFAGFTVPPRLSPLKSFPTLSTTFSPIFFTPAVTLADFDSSTPPTVIEGAPLLALRSPLAWPLVESRRLGETFGPRYPALEPPVEDTDYDAELP